MEGYNGSINQGSWGIKSTHVKSFKVNILCKDTHLCAASREVAGAFFIILTLPHTFAEEALGYL